MFTTESAVLSMDALLSTDRRVHRRASLDVPVLLDNRKSWHPGRCANVSVGGLAVDCEILLPVGEVLDLYFELPNGIAVDARAEVVRCDGKKLALRFTDMGRDAALGLRSHCRHRPVH
jgi:hypothetical protein